MKTKKKIPVSLSVASVLLCLVLLSAHFTSGMYARYVTRASGGDASRIADFAVSAEDNKEAVTITAGQNSEDQQRYVVTVKNGSEVAVSFEAKLVFPGLEDAPEYTIQGVNKSEQSENGILKGYLAPQDSKELTVSFDLDNQFSQPAAEGLDFSNTNISGDNGEIPFEVIVTFTQIN